MKRKLALILALVATLSLVGCGQKEEKQPEQSVAVTVQTVKNGNIKNTNTFIGTTKAKEETSISAEIGGTAEKVNVTVGQQVHKGDLLLKIKSTDVNDGVNAAKATVESAKAASDSSYASTKAQYESVMNNAQIAYDEAKRNYEIQTELYKADAISEDTYKKVENSYNTAKASLEAAIKNYNEVLPKVEKGGQANVAQAQASLDSANNKLKKLTLVSPVDGIVTEKKCNDGEAVAAGSPIFTISNPNIIQIDLYVSATDIDKFKVGESVNITINGEETTGTIQTVPSATSSSNSLYAVEVIFDNSNQKFKPGMAAEVEVNVEEAGAAISVPKKAIVEEDNKKYIYIVSKDKKAKKVEVETGIETTDDIEIKNGLSDGDTVVIAGQSLIGDGTKLFPVQKKEE